MSKKTFLLIFGLMAGCGMLALAVFKVAPTSREQRKKAAAIWTVNADSSNVHQLVFEADGKTLISVHGDTQKWDVATRKLKSYLPRKGNSWLKYSPDAKYYAYGVFNRYAAPSALSVNLHNAHTDALLQTFALPKEAISIYADEIVLSHHGTLLNINYKLRHKHQKNRETILTEVFTIWDIRTKKQLMSRSRKVTKETQRHVYDAPFFSPDDRQLLLLESEIKRTPYSQIALLKVSLKNLLTDETVATYSIAPDENSLLSDRWKFACMSPDSSSIVAVNVENEVTGFMRSGEKYNGTLYAFSPHTQKVLWKRHANGLMTQALAFSPDGKLIAWGGHDLNRDPAPGYYSGKGKLLLLEAKDGEIITEFTEQIWIDRLHQKQLTKIESVKQLFNIKRTSRTAPLLPGDNGVIESLAFSPDGKTLAVGYFGGLIKLWRVPRK